MLLGATEPVGQMRIVCPACGKNNRLDATFKCRVCGRENLCLEHRQKETGLCKDCADKVKKAKSWLKKVLEDDMKLCGRCAECLDGEHGEEVRRGVLELCLVYSELAADDLAGQTATKLLRAVCAPLGEIDDLKKTVNDLKKQVDAAKASLHENPDPSTLKTSSVKAVVQRPLTHSERVRIKTAMNAITSFWRERPEISGPADELAAAGSDAEALEAIRKMECAIRCDFEGENSGVARLKRLPAFFGDIAVLNSSAPTSSPSGVDRALESLFAMARVYCAHIMIG